VKARQKVKRRAFLPGARDAYGNPTQGWDEPEPVAVYGWGPASPDTAPHVQGRDPVTCDVDLLAPIGTVCGHKDRWTLPDGDYDQVGDPQDYSHGPFGFHGGLRIALTRVKG
jgi:hypothetical protein